MKLEMELSVSKEDCDAMVRICQNNDIEYESRYWDSQWSIFKLKIRNDKEKDIVVQSDRPLKENEIEEIKKRIRRKKNDCKTKGCISC